MGGGFIPRKTWPESRHFFSPMRSTKTSDRQGVFTEMMPSELESRILAASQRDPRCADSDRHLALEIWAEEGLDDAIVGGLECFQCWFEETATGFETIARVSRKLRAAGLVRVSPAVALRRKQLAEEHRQFRGGR